MSLKFRETNFPIGLKGNGGPDLGEKIGPRVVGRVCGSGPYEKGGIARGDWLRGYRVSAGCLCGWAVWFHPVWLPVHETRGKD